MEGAWSGKCDATGQAHAEAAAVEKGLATSGILNLRFHDLRGTAATNFIRAGLDLDDVAMILGWAKGKVEQIAARYVTSEVIGLALVEKLGRNKANTKAVKDAVEGASNGPA